MTAYWASPRHIIGLVLAVFLLLGIFWIIASFHSTPIPTDKLRIVGTFYPLYEFAGDVGGDRVVASNVTPAGAEPHDYEPSSQQMVLMEKSDAVVYNGATLEPWIRGFLLGYHGEAIAASQGVSLIAEGSQTNPHFWLDPVLAQQIVDNIQHGLVQIDPTHASYYQDRAKTYNAKLAQLDGQFRQGLANCQLHMVITSHNTLGYVAKRYGFEARSIAGLSPDAEPSPAKLAEIAQVVKTNKVPVILFETLVSPKIADTLASETGAGTAIFDPLEGLTTQDLQQGKNYISVQQQNLQVLRKAMKCQ